MIGHVPRSRARRRWELCDEGVSSSLCPRVLAAAVGLESLGHCSSATTERYAHLSPDHLMKVADLTIPPVSVTRLSRGQAAAEAGQNSTDSG